MEEEADSAKANTTKNNLENTTPTIGKTFQTCEAERLEEGGLIILDPANEQLCLVQTLWQIQPPRDGVSDKEK